MTTPLSIIYGYEESRYRELLEEDNLIEYLTSISYLVAGIISLIIYRIFFKSNKKKFSIIYLILGIIFLVGGFEEISWGQRILDIETPDVFSSNLQNEITLHNLKGIQETIVTDQILIATFGAFAWIFVHHRKNSPEFGKYFIPNWYFLVFFLPFFLFGVRKITHFLKLPEVNAFVLSKMLLFHTHEFYEFYLSAGIMFFVVSVYMKLKSPRITNSN